MSSSHRGHVKPLKAGSTEETLPRPVLLGPGRSALTRMNTELGSALEAAPVGCQGCVWAAARPGEHLRELS